MYIIIQHFNNCIDIKSSIVITNLLFDIFSIETI